jgi:tubulin-specific chaperone E
MRLSWTGIEWDEWGQGLNDGSVTLPSGERVIYFVGPTPRMSKSPPGVPEFKCSFVKQTKLEAEMQRATFVGRLQERYDPTAIGGERLAASVARGKDVVIAGEVGTAMGSQRPIELVGVNKLRIQQTLETIEKISLAQCQIASLGLTSPGDLTRLAPRIVELDLSFNLLNSWDSIFAFLEELPLLETLILTGNRLVYDEANAPTENGELKQYPQVKVLVVNQTMIPWGQLTTIARHHFPQLTELHVASNEIRDADFATADTHDLTAAGSWVRSLQVLDLSDNALGSWKAIESHIGRLCSNIKQLVVNGNQVSTLVIPSSTTETPKVFQQLVSLSLNDNLIDSWTSIDALNSYRSLDTFRFMRNPLVAQMGAGETRTVRGVR